MDVFLTMWPECLLCAAWVPCMDVYQEEAVGSDSASIHKQTSNGWKRWYKHVDRQYFTSHWLHMLLWLTLKGGQPLNGLSTDTNTQRSWKKVITDNCGDFTYPLINGHIKCPPSFFLCQRKVNLWFFFAHRWFYYDWRGLTIMTAIYFCITG